MHDAMVDTMIMCSVEERMECELIRSNDGLAADIGPGERIVAIEIVDGNELVPDPWAKGGPPGMQNWRKSRCIFST